MKEKREHDTSLNAGAMVSKVHPRVEFRGRLDSLCAMIVELQIQAESRGLASLVEELQEVAAKIYDILSCEVTGRECEAPFLWGMDSDEIRERSHYPERYFGLGHIRPHYTMGVAAAGLNALRTQIREAELSACRAFAVGEAGEEVTRPDVVKALNRLSSAVYILTYKYLPSDYDKLAPFARKSASVHDKLISGIKKSLSDMSTEEG